MNLNYILIYIKITDIHKMSINVTGNNESNDCKLQKKYSIITITMSTKTNNCSLNIYNIGKYLELDNEITGIKYKIGRQSNVCIRGTYSTRTQKKNNTEINHKNLFYNQVSMVFHGSKNYNVKVFDNGSMHITGCKNVSDGNKIAKAILNKLSRISYELCINFMRDSNGVLIDSDYIIYKESYPHSNIGYYINGTYIINSKNCDIDPKTKFFVTQKYEEKYIKYLYDRDGEFCGKLKLNIKANKKKIYTSNVNITTIGDCIYHDTTLIAHTDYIFKSTCEKQSYVITNSIPEKTLIEFVNQDYNINSEIYTNINMINVKYTLGYELNRQRLYKCLIDNGYISKYNPSVYSGLTFVYKIHNIMLNSIEKLYNHSGKCSCHNKCTCISVSFLIFQSGNVIITGIRNPTHIDALVTSFVAIMKPFENIIKKRTFDY